MLKALEDGKTLTMPSAVAGLHMRWGLVPSGFPPLQDHSPWMTVSETSQVSKHKTSHFSGSTRPSLCVNGSQVSI